jgi:RNA-directed DNA polymerase
LRRIGFLFEQLTDFSNLYLAAQKAFKAMRGGKSGAAFFFNLESQLLSIQEELIHRTYRPSQYSYFTIHDPKERVISVAPFRDRVVHHALINVMEPIYENVFIYDSYATRKNKGTHKAVERAKDFLKDNRWFLKADVYKYFDSINHDTLLKIVCRKIKDEKLLNVLSKIITNGGKKGVGLPIGNLTSQFFANVYLDQLDHFIKDELGMRYYIRYMDDIVVFEQDKEILKQVREIIRSYLKEQLQLKFKENAVYINQSLNGLSFLGRRIFPDLVRLNNVNLKRSIKRMKQRRYEFHHGIINEEQFKNSLQSLIGHIGSVNSYQLRQSLFKGG